MPNWLKKICVFLTIFELIYLLVALFLLNGPYVRKWINTDPQSIEINYAWGVSPIPSLVYLRDFNMRIQDSNIQLFFKLDSVLVGIHLPRLLDMEFYSYLVKGDGLQFLFRLKRFEKDLKKLKPGVLADIPGLPSLLKSPPKPDDGSKKWRANIHGVRLSNVYELWFEEFRFQGKASVDGGFWLIPSEEVEVFPATVSIRDGVLRLSDKIWAENVHFVIRALLERSRSDDLDGINFVKHMRIDLDGGTNLSDLSFLNYYLQGVDWIKIRGDRGQVSTALEINKGLFSEKSRFTVDAQALSVLIGKFALHGDPNILWEAKSKAGDPRLNLDWKAFSFTHAGGVPIAGREFTTEIAGAGRSLEEVLQPSLVSFKLPRTEFPSLSFINSFFPKASGIRIDGGVGFVEVELEDHFKRNAARGFVKVEAEKLKAKMKDVTLNGSIGLMLPVRSGNLGKGRLDISGTELKLRRQTSPSNWEARIVASPARANLESAVGFLGDIALKATNARPILSTYFSVSGDHLPGWLENLLSFDDLSLSLNLEANEDRFKVSQLHGEGKSNRLRGWYQQVGKHLDGRILIEAGEVAAGIYFQGDEAKLRLHDAIGWFEKGPSR